MAEGKEQEQVAVDWERFNRDADIPALLRAHHWTQGQTRGDRVDFTRPGKAARDGVSANWDTAQRVFFVFTTSSEFSNTSLGKPHRAGRAFNAVQVFCILECNGDMGAAARKLIELGYSEDDPQGDKRKVKHSKGKDKPDKRRQQYKPQPLQISGAGRKIRQVKTAQRFPLTMTLPPDKATVGGLALPNGQWQRAADGSITVTFRTAFELEDCLTATAACRAARDMTAAEVNALFAGCNL
jgi:hypothetical protein